MKTRYYYTAKKISGFYRGCVYYYDPTGERELIEWLGSLQFDTPEQAVDAAAEYCDEHDIDAELD